LTREYFEGIRRQKVSIINQTEEEDSTTEPVKKEEKFFGWRPHSIAGFFGNVIQDTNNFRLEIGLDDIHYVDKKSNRILNEKPNPYRLLDAGTDSSTLLHLAHNMVAVLLTLILMILNHIFSWFPKIEF